MTMLQNITMKVPTKQAQKFKQLNPQERDILEMLVASWLNNKELDLDTIMDFIGYKAQQNGLTPEIFEQIVNEKID
jgi:phage terminase Nu1 subunit (DNA packaging protein)